MDETSNTTALATRREPTGIVAAQGRGVVLESLDDMWRAANIAVRSGLVPKGLDSQEAAFMAIAMGAEVGLPMVATLRNTYVVNCRPTFFGDLPLALCRRSPAWDESQFKEWETAEESFCQCARKGGNPVVASFSNDDAKRAGLLGKDLWNKYPKRMRKFKARAFALRDAFPDVLLGVPIMEDVVGSEDADTSDPLAVTASGQLSQQLKASAGTCQAPPIIDAATVTTSTAVQVEPAPAATEAPAPTQPAADQPKRRGRPPKSAQAQAAPTAEPASEPAEPEPTAQTQPIEPTAEPEPEPAPAAPVDDPQKKADLIAQVRSLAQQVGAKGGSATEILGRFGFAKGNGKTPQQSPIEELSQIVDAMTAELSRLMAKESQEWFGPNA